MRTGQRLAGLPRQKQAGAFPLRVTTEIRDMLQKAADANFRSLNAEIAYRIVMSFQEKK